MNKCIDIDELKKALENLDYNYTIFVKGGDTQEEIKDFEIIVKNNVISKK